MRFIPHQNVNSSVITVTNAATALFTLINTAGSVTNSQTYFTSPSTNQVGVGNGFLITPEDGDIRLGYGVTPTAALGTLLSSGTKYFLPNFDLEDIKLIRTSGDVKCSIDVVTCINEDSYSGVAEAVTIETGSVTIGKVDISGGQAADGAAVSGNPVRIGGKDGAGNTQDVITDTDGHLQVDVLSGDITETNSGTIKTAVEKIDDWEDTGNFADYAKATVYGDNGAGSPVKMLMDAAGNPQVDVVTQPVRDRLTDNVGVALQTDVILSDTTALTPKFVAINATVNGDNTLVAAVADKKIRVLSYTLVADAAVGAAFEDGAGGSELAGQMAFGANGGVSVAFSPVGHFETTANTLLNLETDAAANVRGHLTYIEV